MAAAAMWCVAAIGLAAGLGMYLMTVLAAILVVVALWRLLPTRIRSSSAARSSWSDGAASGRAGSERTGSADA